MDMIIEYPKTLQIGANRITILQTPIFSDTDGMEHSEVVLSVFSWTCNDQDPDSGDEAVILLDKESLHDLIVMLQSVERRLQ